MPFCWRSNKNGGVSNAVAQPCLAPDTAISGILLALRKPLMAMVDRLGNDAS